MITDRTQTDVDYALLIRNKLIQGEPLTPQEQADYMAGLRGAYNISDLNRVESKVEELRNRHIANGYPVEAIEIKTWQKGDFLKRTDFEQYLNNLDILKTAYFIKMDTPVTPKVSDWINYKIANDIEKILVDIENILNNMIASLLYCGDTIGVI